MVAYMHFCHHLTDDYVDLSDLYVVSSVFYVDLSDHYVSLSENKSSQPVVKYLVLTVCYYSGIFLPSLVRLCRLFRSLC